MDTENTTDSTKKDEPKIAKPLTFDLPKPDPKPLKIGSVIALSLVFGLLGSVIGNAYLVPLIKKNSALVPAVSGEVKTVQINEQSATVDVVREASPAVVSIIISKDLNKLQNNSSLNFGPFNLDPFFQSRGNQDAPNVQEVGSGSGFIISEDGLIVTNKHVVEDTSATYTVLTNDGKKFDAKVLSRDPNNDIALVKIEAKNLPTLILGDSSNLQIGQAVIAIGNSLGQYRNTVTTGVISGIARNITAGSVAGSEQLEGVIQTDAAINPGNSGGPLLDLGGSVIGINTAIDQQGQLVGFAIPVNDIKHDIESFNKYGQIVKPFLGVRYVLVNQSVKEQNNLPVDYGAFISGDSSGSAVVAGSAAAKAGLKAGDIILEVNGNRIDEDHSLALQLKSYYPDDVVRMKIMSGSEVKEITVTLGQAK